MKHKAAPLAKEVPHRYLSAADAAKYTGVGKRTLARLRDKGGGPPYIKPQGGRVVYEVGDLDKWMAERKFRSVADEASRTASPGSPEGP